jgi:hypothetical protein
MDMANHRGRRFGGRGTNWDARLATTGEQRQVLQNRQNWLKQQLELISRLLDEFEKPHHPER